MKKLLIVVLLIVAQIGAFYLKAHSQVAHPADTVLLADETTLNYTKTEAVIKCSNESVFNTLYRTHGTLFKNFTWTWKTDRHGKYKHYVVHLSKGDAQVIQLWSKTHL